MCYCQNSVVTASAAAKRSLMKSPMQRKCFAVAMTRAFGTAVEVEEQGNEKVWKHVKVSGKCEDRCVMSI